MQKKQGYASNGAGIGHRPEYALPRDRNVYTVKTIRPAKPGTKQAVAARPQTKPHRMAETDHRIVPMPERVPIAETNKPAEAPDKLAERRMVTLKPEPTPASDAFKTQETPKASRSRMSRMAMKAVNADMFAQEPETAPAPSTPTSRMAMKAANAEKFFEDAKASDTVEARLQPELRAVPPASPGADRQHAPRTAASSPQANKPAATRTRQAVRMPFSGSELDPLDDDVSFIDAPPKRHAGRAFPNKPHSKGKGRQHQAGDASVYPAIKPSRPEMQKRRRIIILAGLALVAAVAALFLLLNQNRVDMPAQLSGPMATVYAETEAAGMEPTQTPSPALAGAAVVPSPTPSPSATPSAAPTATPSATATATPKPTTTPKPTAKPTATPKPTVKPTATPKPTVKPTATPKPSATATPKPSATATPKPTATAAPDPTPESAGPVETLTPEA